MLVTDNESWDALFRSLRNQGRSADAQWLRHDRLGFNYRMDEMSAALGLSQFRRINDLLCRREALAERYAARLSGCAEVEALAPPRAGMTRSWFLYVIRVAAHVDRDRLMIRLAARGITSRPYLLADPPADLLPGPVRVCAGRLPLRRSGGPVDARTPDAARHRTGRCRLRLRCSARRAGKTMSATGVSLAVVIPTRNRATLAIAACESLLAQADGTFHLFVSDNSTEPGEVRQLAELLRRR